MYRDARSSRYVYAVVRQSIVDRFELQYYGICEDYVSAGELAQRLNTDGIGGRTEHEWKVLDKPLWSFKL